MTLTADQLFCIIAAAQALAVDTLAAGGFPSSELVSAISAASEQATGMEAPITAEALTAAGWEHDECWFDLPGSIVSVQQRDATTFDVYVIGYGASVPAKGVTNMYALGQLVELLGGK